MTKTTLARRSRRDAGFTLLELLTVAAILAIIGGGMLVAYEDLDDKASEGVAAHTIASLDQAVRTYAAVNKVLPDNLDSLVAADPADVTTTSAEKLAIFGRPDKVNTPVALTAGQLTALNNAGIRTLRYVDVLGNDITDPAPNSGTTVTLDALNGNGVAAVVGPLFNIDIPHRVFETPRPGNNRNRGRGFGHTLVAGSPVATWNANQNSGGTPGGWDNRKLGAGPDDVLILFGLGNDASIVGASKTRAQIPSAPVYYQQLIGKYEYSRYLLAVNVGPASAPFAKARLQAVLNSHGDFVDEMISQHALQKQ